MDISNMVQGLVDFHEIHYKGKISCILGVVWGKVNVYRCDKLVDSYKSIQFAPSQIFKVYFKKDYAVSRADVVLDSLSKF